MQSLRALAAAGADPNLASADGTTALMSAAGQGYSRGGGEGAFIRDRRDFSSYNPVAAEGGGGIPAEEEKLAYEAVSIVLDSGGQVSAANRAGDTALHSATVLGMASVVRLLVERGADVNAKNKAGLTPLGVATRSGRRAGGGTAGVAEFLKLNGGR